ncbi:MAG: hypothetical protein ACRDXX_05570 [Stackebrandtia sp.]
MLVELPDGAWPDWEVPHRNAEEPRLASHYDLACRHGLEVAFSDAVYVSCPMYFQDAAFREPTPDEHVAVERMSGERPPLLVAFDADAGGGGTVACLVAAAGVEVTLGLVYRCRRDDLGEGERLAPWAKPPHGADETP